MLQFTTGPGFVLAELKRYLALGPQRLDYWTVFGTCGAGYYIALRDDDPIPSVIEMTPEKFVAKQVAWTFQDKRWCLMNEHYPLFRDLVQRLAEYLIPRRKPNGPTPMDVVNHAVCSWFNAGLVELAGLAGNLSRLYQGLYDDDLSGLHGLGLGRREDTNSIREATTLVVWNAVNTYLVRFDA